MKCYRLVRVSHKPSRETEIEWFETTLAGEDLLSPSTALGASLPLPHDLSALKDKHPHPHRTSSHHLTQRRSCSCLVRPLWQGRAKRVETEGPPGPGAQQPSGDPGEEGTLTLGLHLWGEDPVGWTGFGQPSPLCLKSKPAPAQPACPPVGTCVVFWWLLALFLTHHGFPDSSAGKESACNAGDPGSIPGSGRSAGEGIGYPGQCCWASLVAQLVKNPPAAQTWVRSLSWEYPLEKGKATHPSILAWRIPWTEEPGGLQSMGLQSRTRLKWLSTHECTWQVSLWGRKTLYFPFNYLDYNCLLSGALCPQTPGSSDAWGWWCLWESIGHPVPATTEGWLRYGLVSTVTSWELVLLALDNQYSKDQAFCFHYYLLGYT